MSPQPSSWFFQNPGVHADPGDTLVVDDESAILDTLRILLKNEGFTPYTAHGGRAGLEQIEAVSPDIVLTDVRMPNVTGVEVLSAARRHDPDTPVILMTAQASLQSAVQAVNEGAFYYIQKPFRNDELIAILRRHAASDSHIVWCFDSVPIRHVRIGGPLHKRCASRVAPFLVVAHPNTVRGFRECGWAARGQS